MIDYKKKKFLESKGFKSKYPPKEGYVVPLTDDRMFRMFCRDNNNRCFLAKLISLVTHIDYDLLVDRMVIVDSSILDDSVINHYNEQDIVVSIDNFTINLEMSNDLRMNKRKNEKTAFKYAGNQYKVGSSYDDVYVFYQICIENYDLFGNDYLINEVKMTNVTSGKYEVESDEFKKFHINLKLIEKLCYNDSEINKFFKFFILDKEEELEELCEGDELLMDAYKHLKSMSHDSIPMSKLEEQELEEYCQRIAMKEERAEGRIEGEKSKQIEIARKSLEQGIDKDTISVITGLSIEEINNLN